VGVRSIDWQNRTHFFAISAQLMRRILTDFARSRHYQKRGGGATHVSFDEAFVLSAGKDPDLVALDVALDKLSLVDPRKKAAWWNYASLGGSVRKKRQKF
jgi:hypothetical protein